MPDALDGRVCDCHDLCMPLPSPARTQPYAHIAQRCLVHFGETLPRVWKCCSILWGVLVVGTILPSDPPPPGLHCRFPSGVLHQPTLQVGAHKGPAEAVQSIFFDRTGQEKGQAPGRQINLMKFVIGCGNISLVIKAGVSHKKLLIKPLPLSPRHISSFTVAGTF